MLQHYLRMEDTAENSVYFYVQNIFGALLALLVVRVIIVYLRIHSKKKTATAFRKSAKLMIVLGSGGHTHEMLELVKNVDHQISPRIYVSAETDSLSENKAKKLEESRKDSSSPFGSVELFYEKIPRSREVKQSWFTTVVTTLKAFVASLYLVYKHMPDAILCNGPGTCVPICLAAVLFHILGIKHILLIYVESMCRVKTLSLSGKILYPFADYFYVNWPELKEHYPRSEHVCLF